MPKKKVINKKITSFTADDRNRLMGLNASKRWRELALKISPLVIKPKGNVGSKIQFQLRKVLIKATKLVEIAIMAGRDISPKALTGIDKAKAHGLPRKIRFALYDRCVVALKREILPQ
jgi:hypothetical protein